MVFLRQNLFYRISSRIAVEEPGFIRYLFSLFFWSKNKFHANSKQDIEIANGLVMNEEKQWKYKYFAIQFHRAQEKGRQFKDHKIVREWAHNFVKKVVADATKQQNKQKDEKKYKNI